MRPGRQPGETPQHVGSRGKPHGAEARKGSPGTAGAKMKKKETFSPEVETAAREYIARQSRDTHPDGTFDRAGRWYPSESEWCNCCTGIRSPSRAYPYSLMTHCRSAGHVAALYGVDARDLRRAIKYVKALEVMAS